MGHGPVQESLVAGLPNDNPFNPPRHMHDFTCLAQADLRARV